MTQLETEGPTLGPALWAIESKRVEKLVVQAEAEEKAAAEAKPKGGTKSGGKVQKEE